MTDRISLASRLLTAAKGGAIWAKALATGDIAPEQTTEERRAICRTCESRRVEQLPGMTSPGAWCGPPLENRIGEEEIANRTCGCLLYGKTMVASESCPQAKWKAVTLTKESKPIDCKEDTGSARD